MEFLTWQMLSTFAGTLAMVALITQLTKGIGVLARIPTQIWSYAVALLVMYPSSFFVGNLDLRQAILIPFNAVLAALAANGGYEAVNRIISLRTEVPSDRDDREQSEKTE